MQHWWSSTCAAPGSSILGGASHPVQHHHCAVLYESRSICTISTTEVLNSLQSIQNVQHEHYKEVQHYQYDAVQPEQYEAVQQDYIPAFYMNI